jgi:hypothetical protein
MLVVGSFSLGACNQDEQTQEQVQEKEQVRGNAIRKTIQHTLSYSAGENGTIVGAVHQTVDHGEDGNEITAVADDGHHFIAWSDGVVTASRTDRKVSEALAVIAAFSLNQYTLSYTAGDNGTIQGPVSQILDHGTDAEPVTAVPDDNYHFTMWSDGVTKPTRADHNVMADHNVKASFEINRYPLTYKAAEHGRINGASQQTVKHGHFGTEVTAVNEVGYHFTAWSDGVTTPARTDRNIVADLAVTAGFEVNQYPLAYNAGEHGHVEGRSQQVVNHGEDGTEVIAVAERGYHFVNWSDGMDSARRLDTKIEGDLSVNAVFDVNTYNVGGRVSGLVEDTQLVLQNNSGDDLVITVNGDFSFAGSLDAEPYAVTVSSQPVTPNQTCTVNMGSGVVSGADVADIEVTCVLNTYSIGGMVTGLPDGDRLIMQNNGSDDLTVKADGTFAFAMPLEDGSNYVVTVFSPPGKPNWTCDIDNGAGTLSGNDVGDIDVNCYVKAVLRATPGLKKITLDWNAYDFSDVTFSLCHSQGEMSVDDTSTCEEIQGGTDETQVSSPHVLAGLTSDIPYSFRLEVLHANGRKTYSDIVVAMAFGGLNDSGIEWCAENNSNHQTDGTRSEMAESCYALAGAYPGQDAHFGRDALARGRKLAKTGNGAAGFDFTKVCRSGKVAGERGCSPNPSPGSRPNKWGCTRDNVTGLTWEVKDDSGLHAYGNTYSWFNPDETLNGGTTGVKNGGECQGSSCDTHAFIQKVNELELCGHSDWRLPTRKELLSIVDNSRFKPAIDSSFFPNAAPDYYWSSSPYADQAAAFAWQVSFLYGEASPSEKKQSRHVRLVRGRTLTFGLDNP